MTYANTVLITGATSGIGAAAARAFTREGARLILSGRRAGRLEALAETLAVPVHAIPLDVRDRDAVFRAISSLPEDFRHVDVLINNAGLALGLDPAPECDLDQWEQMVDTNIRGVLYVTNALLPGMLARQRGHILNLGSIAGTYPYPGGNVYGGTKAFLRQFSLNLKADLLGTPVRVTNIEPGMVHTEFSEVRFGGDKAAGDAVYADMQPLTAEDIAETLVWCATRPAHVNINTLEIMPTQQAFSAFAVTRRGET